MREEVFIPLDLEQEWSKKHDDSVVKDFSTSSDMGLMTIWVDQACQDSRERYWSQRKQKKLRLQ
jgi:hypothetical protein